MFVKPFLHWAGGKRQLLSILLKHIPPKFNTYYEPFVGAGAFLFALQPTRAIINDINCELINVYNVLIGGKVNQLIQSLKKHQNTPTYYYKLRDTVVKLSSVESASRFIYLNKTCYNGLYRENQ